MRRRHIVLVVAAAVLVSAVAPAASAAAVAGGGFPLDTVSWRVLDNGSDQTPSSLPSSTHFASPDYVESIEWREEGLLTGHLFGYGDSTRTLFPTLHVRYGPTPQEKYVTTYFRKTFEIENAAAVVDLALTFFLDDGAVMYINGVEVHRANMPTGPVASTTLASTAIEGSAEIDYTTVRVPPAVLVEGANVIAVEVHQVESTSPDLAFALGVTARDIEPIVPEAPLAVLLPIGGLAVFVALSGLRRRVAG